MRIRANGKLTLVALVVISLLATVIVAPVSAAPTVSVNRITSDGAFKYSIQISGDGSTVAWVEEQVIPGQSYDVDVVKVAATDGSWVKEVFRFDAKTEKDKVQGPHYRPDDNFYRISQGSLTLRLSQNGSVLVMLLLEGYDGGYSEGFGVIDVRTGSIKFVPVAIPAGMGANDSLYSVNIHRTGFDLSDDGKKLVYTVNAYGEGDYYGADAVIALDIATGQTTRLAGYTAKDPNTRIIRVGDHPYWLESQVATGGDQVAFSAYGLPSVGEAFYTVNLSGGGLRQVVNKTVGTDHQIVGPGLYFYAQKTSSTGAFYPVAGGTAVEVSAPNSFFDDSFWDGEPGVILHPMWTSNEQELIVSRAAGRTTVLRPGEHGLPGGMKFGVKSIGGYDYRFASANGKKVVLSLLNPDGTSQDLFLAIISTPGSSGTVSTGTGGTGTAGGTTATAGTGGGTSDTTSAAGSLTLTWNASTEKDPRGTSAYGYYLYRSITPGQFGDYPLTDFPWQSLQYVDKGLEPGKTYYYKVVPAFQGGYTGTPMFLSAMAQAPVTQVTIWLKINHPVAKVNGQEVSLNVAPFMDNGRTMVPLRFIGEKLGAEIRWEPSAQQITYIKGDMTVILWVGRNQALVNGEARTIDVPPRIVNGSTVVPLRFVATALGAKTAWDGLTQEITITP